MQITDVRAHHLRVEDPNMTLFDGSYDDCVIIVETDSGLTGIGEVESLAPAIMAMVNAKDAHSRARGLRGVLLGGIRHDRLEAYGTIYPLEKTPAGVAKQVERAMGMNLKNVKLVADPWWHEDLRLTASLFRAARETLGDLGKILVDAALSYKTAEVGLRMYPIYRKTNIHFLEAPLPLDDMEGHARMAREGIPLGVGDLGLTHVNEFVEGMDRMGAAVCQPDITMVGGFTELKRIAKEATARGKRVVPHGYKTNIEIAANMQFLASRPNADLLEFSTSRSPLRWELTRERLAVEADGKVAVPRRPGLGVTLNRETFEKYLVR